MPDALPPATPAPFTPIDYTSWEATPEAARIEDPLQKIQAFDNRTRKDLFKAGLYDAEAEDEIFNAGADQALRAGHITDKSEYASAPKAQDPNFLARQLVRKGDTAKAQDIYRYQSFLSRPDTDPETLERARVAAEVDPETENELVRGAVRSGERPFAVLPDKDGNAIFEIDPELGALDRQQILDLAGDDIDPRFLPDLEKQLTRVEGTNYTPAQFRQAGVFDGFLKNQIKEDPFLGDVLERAQTEYNRTGQISEEVTGELDRTFAALDADNEFSPATRSRLIRDTIKRASKLEGYDPENPQQHIQYLEDGTVWLPEQVIFDQAKHDQVLDSLSVTPEQKEAAKKLRAGRLESIAPAMVDAMGANPDALDFFEKSKAAGKSDSEIATEWYSKPENYSWWGNRARGIGMSIDDAFVGLVQSGAAVLGSESAREGLQARQQDIARNREYARLSGDSYGVGMTTLNAVTPMVADLLAGLLVSVVATPVAGVAVAGARTAASSLLRSMARTAIREGGRGAVRSLVRTGTESAARTLATLGDDLVSEMARKVGGEVAERAAVRGATRAIAGQTGVAASSFTRSAGSAYVQAYSALDAQTNAQGRPLYSDEEKRKIALGTAMTAGTATAAITLGFGKILGGGVEDLVTGKIGTGILKRVFGATDDQIVSATRTSALAILSAAGAEAPEEAADQLVGNVIQALGTGEEFRLGPALKEALEAGLVGGLLGAGTKSIEVGIDKYRDAKVVALEKANAPAAAAALEARNKAAATTPAAKPTVINQDGLRVQENPPLSPDPFSYGEEDPDAQPGQGAPLVIPQDFAPLSGDLSAGYGDEPAVGITDTAGAVRVSAAEIESQIDAVDVQIADLKVVPTNETEGQKVRRTRRLQELNAEKTRLKAGVKNAKASGGFVLVNSTNTTAEQAAITAEAEVAALDEEIAALSVTPAKETKAAATKREASLEKVRAARAEAATIAQTRRAAAPIPWFAEGQSDPRALDYGAGGELTVQDNTLGGTPAPRARASTAPAAATSVEQLDPENFIAEFRAERPDSKESDAEIRARHARMISTAILGRDADGRGPRPVSAAAARAYGIDAPAGWTETGRLLVPPAVPAATAVPEDIIGTDQAPEPPDVEVVPEPGDQELDYGDGSELTVQDNPLGGPAPAPTPKPQTTKATKFSQKARALVERMLTPESRTQPPEYLQQQKAFTPTQTQIQSRIAALYEAMPVDDSANPEVVQAYQNLVTEVVAQYRAMLGTGIKIEMGSENPYATSGDMIDDVERGRLWIYKTEPSSYGSDAMLNAGNHPMLAPTEFTDLNGEPMLANDVFRAVHDYVAHAAFGFSFGPLGEEAAWKAHLSTLRDPLARLALTTETRGQNSWVNYRPEMLRDGMPIKKGEPGYVAPQDRPFATQKFALLPEESMTLVPIVAPKRGKAPKTKKPTEKQLAVEMRAGTPLAVHETLFNDTISQGWVPTRNVLLKQLAEAGFGGQVYGKAFAATAEAKIQELYPVTDVSKQKGVVFPTLDSLGFGDIKGPDNKTVKIPVFADDNTSGPFTNDPQTTAWQKNAGLSIKVPAGVAVNPAIKVNPRTGFVDYSTHNSGARIYAKGDFKRAGNTIGSYLAFQNKQGFGASLETLPPFDSSKLAGPVDFAGMRIIPGVTTEDDILRFYFAPSSDGGPSKIESAINASASGMSAVDKDQIRAAAQLSFIRELREFTLDMNDVGSVDPKGFLRTPDGYKAGIENRIANVWSKADRGKDGVIDTSEHWNERGRPSHLAFFVKDSIRNHEKANERRPDANVQLGSDDVDQATALERAAARNDADNAGDMLVALDEAFTPEVLRGSAAIMGMPPETGIVDVASGVQILVSRIDSVPALRKAFEQAYLATLDLPAGPSAKRAVAIQKAKAMASDELVVLASRSALVQPGVVQAVRDAGFFKSLAPGLNTFPDKPKPKRPDAVVKMPAAPVLAPAPTPAARQRGTGGGELQVQDNTLGAPAFAPTPMRQRGTGGGELQVQDNTLGAPDFAPTPMRQRGTGGGELQVQDNTLGAPDFAPAPATEPSPPMVYEGGALVPQDNTLAGQEWESTPVSHTVAATSEQSLTPEEKAVAAKELGFPTWTPEARTSFVTRFTDWFASGGKLAVGALLPLFNKVRVIIAAGTLAMTSMISINDATPRDIRSISPAKIAEAVATPKVKQAAAPAKRAAPVQRLVDFDGVSASSNVRVMAQWILDTKDSDGQPFVVAEKVSGVIYVFSGDGVLVKKAPALFGATPGDIQTQEQRDLTIEQRRTTKAAQVTEAGRFPSVISNTGDSYGDTAVFNPYKHTISALHIPYLGRPAENRAERLASPTPEDNRVSLGCVNIPADAMSEVVSQFKDGGVIYILPETEAGKQLYPGFANLDIPSEMPTTRPDMAARARMDSVAYLDQATIPTIREDNRAAIADLQLDGDLRSAIERIARSAKYPRRYRAIMLAALKMQVLPNISIVDAPAEAYAGSYTHSARLITLNLASSNGRGMLDVLAHELLHAATLEAIANPQTKAAKELLARLERARQKAAEVVPSDMSYAVSSIDEFITHAATDPRLQVILRETFEKGKTTWQRVVDAIAKFFGIANPDFVSDLWGFINHAAEYGLRPGVAASREQRSMPGTDWTRRDAEYLAAVESGDLAAAQRMVDEAARDAGYQVNRERLNSNRVPRADERGFWHWSTADSFFNTFDSGRSPEGFHFGSFDAASDRASAVRENIEERDGTYFNVFLSGRPVRILDSGDNNPSNIALALEQQGIITTEQEIRIRVAHNKERYAAQADNTLAAELAKEEQGLRDRGRLAGGPLRSASEELTAALPGALFVYENKYEHKGEDSFIVFSPSQIKSADPVTRDDAGNVIPLSARFRPSSPDIRYSMPAPAPAATPASTLLEDTKAKTVAGTTVGTRNPTSKTAAESGTDPKALVDRASMRRDPELYRKNAVMLADFPLVAGQVPEAAQMVRKIKAPVIEAQAAFDAASAKLEKARAELKAELARRAGVRATAIKVAEVDKLETGETKIARGDTAIRGMLRNIEQARKAQEKARDKRTAAGEAFKAASKTLMAGDRFPIELADRVYDAIETAAIRNLELLIELFPAALRDTARLWYDGANIIAQKFAADFNTTLNRSSAVLAVFSPQKDWFMNVALAKRMMNVWAKHQNTPFDGQMAAQYLKRAGEPEPIWDKKASDFKKDADGNLLYTKGAKPVLDDDGNIAGWTNWSAESAREKFEKAEEDLAAMRGKTLAGLPIEFQARFIRMWSEVYDSSDFPIVSPDGSFGDNKRSEKGNPQRIAWGSYVTIEKAIAIMTAPEANEMQVISDELGVQHKVRSFYNNIVDPANTDGHVTMDTHAIAAILWQALSGNSPEVTMNFGGGGASGSSNLGVSGLYPAFAEAYRKVAEKFGLLPREIQSITWESVRLLFPAKFKSQKANVEKVREIWRMHELNLLTTQQAHDRIFQIVDEWKRRSTLAGQPGRTAAEAVADGTGVGDPDWAEIARRGQNNSGAPPVAPDAGGLPAGGRRGDGAGRPAVGRRGAGRDAGLLPGSAAGDQPGPVLGALTPEGAAPDGSRGSVDQFLPTLPAGVTYSFDDTRPKYLAFARRSQPGVVTINKQALAAVIAGLSPANARAIVSKIVKHEIAHLAAFSTFTDADIAEMARGMSAHEINEVARRYYDSPDALARLDADLESGAITNEALVEEYLRMQLELATDGATTEATIAFHSNNPGFVARLVRYLKDALVALWRNVAGPQEDYVNRIAISRLAREYRAILRGHKPLRAEPFDPADPNRDTRAALAPQTNTDPDADAAIREIFTESVEDFTTPYKPGDMWRKLFVTRTGDRRFPAISDKRQSSLVANERLVFSRRKQLNAAIKAEKPDAQVLAAAAGDTSPTTTPEQDAYIAEEFAAAMAEAREIEDPAEQATAIAEAYALKQRLTTAAYVETARIKKRRIDEAFAELERTAPKTAANLKAMREGIDNISRIVKEYQPDASPLRMVLGTQEGIYLTRVYRIHHKDGDPLSIMSDPTMADVRERAQDQLMESIIKYRTAEIIEQEAEAGKTIGETEAREAALAEAAEQDLGRILLEDYLLSHGSKALPHNGSDFRTDLTRFFKKMPVPEALRHVLEEVTDPVELLTRTGLNVGMLAASTVFTRDLARAGFTSGAMVTGQQWASYRKLIQEPDNDKYLAMLVDNGWAKRKPAAGYVEVAPDVHVPAWLVKAKEDRDLTYVENFRKVSTTTKKADAGKLADLYAHPDVAAWMDHQFTKQKAVSTDDAKLVQKIGEVFAKATGTSLGIATLGSVGFYSRNLVGTVFFLAANGINPFSAKSMRASKLAVEAFLNRESGEVTKLTGIGVLNDDLRPETIKELLKGETDRPGGLNILELIGKVLGGKKGVEYGAKTTAGLAKLAELATAIDGIAKATAYYAELETMREAYPDKSAKWHEDEAAKVVKLTHQAKSQTPPFIDALTSSSYGRLFAPFLRFKGEMFRLTGNIIAQSAAEIRSDNPAIRARGYKRAAGFAMIAAFSVAGPALISAMYGVGDDEEYALREALPPYLRGNSIIYRPSDDGKSIQSYDFTYLNPFSFVGDPISRMGRAVMRGEPGDGMDELAIWINSNFLSEQILAGAVGEVLRNEDSDGRPITFETDSADDKLIKLSKHLVGSSFTPQSLKALQRSYDTARRGTPEDTPFYETAAGIVVGHAMPLRPRAFETEALALKAARKQAETNRQVRALASQLKRRVNFTDGDIEDIVADLQDSTASLNQDIARMIAGYQGLGLDDAAIAKQLVESGRSREFARAIVFRGIAAGPSITPATRRDMYEAGEKAGGPGGGEKRTRAVAEAMRQYEKVQQVRGVPED